MGAFDSSIGAFVIGTILSTFLLGVTAIQAFYYYQNFTNDKRIYVAIVTFLLILDWTHSAVSCYTIYNWTVTNYGNPTVLVNSPWSFAVDPMMTGIAACVCQFFYAYRVYIVSHRQLYIPIIIIILSLVSLGFAVGATGMIFHLQQFVRFQSWTYGVVTWLSVAAGADVIITATLIYYLSRRKKSGVLYTNNIINRLIELIITTNGLTAAVAIIDAVVFGASNTSYHVVPNLCLVKLYFNSLLASLNARVALEKYLLREQTNQRRLQLPAHKANVTTGLGFNMDDINIDYDKEPATDQVQVSIIKMTETTANPMTSSGSDEWLPSDQQEKHGEHVIPMGY